MVSELQPWDRVETEGSRAFAAFCAFRDLGPYRSMARAVRLLQQRQAKGVATATGGKYQGARGTQVAPRRWWDWHSRFDWKQRAAAYDAHKMRGAREMRGPSCVVGESKYASSLEELTSKAISSRWWASRIAGLGIAAAIIGATGGVGLPVALAVAAIWTGSGAAIGGAIEGDRPEEVREAFFEGVRESIIAPWLPNPLKRLRFLERAKLPWM